MAGINKDENTDFSNCIDRIIKKNPDVLSEEIDDETVLFDPKSRDTYSLNQMGSFVWQLCNGENTVREISDEISTALGVDPDQVLLDVVNVIDDLLDKKLVEIS